jgi:hypothetical protein
MRYCVLRELDCKGFGPGFRTVPEVSLGSILIELKAIGLSGCAGESVGEADRRKILGCELCPDAISAASESKFSHHIS